MKKFLRLVGCLSLFVVHPLTASAYTQIAQATTSGEDNRGSATSNGSSASGANNTTPSSAAPGSSNSGVNPPTTIGTFGNSNNVTTNPPSDSEQNSINGNNDTSTSASPDNSGRYDTGGGMLPRQ